MNDKTAPWHIIPHGTSFPMAHHSPWHTIPHGTPFFTHGCLLCTLQVSQRGRTRLVECRVWFATYFRLTAPSSANRPKKRLLLKNAPPPPPLGDFFFMREGKCDCVGGFLRWLPKLERFFFSSLFPSCDSCVTDHHDFMCDSGRGEVLMCVLFLSRLCSHSPGSPG